MVLKSAHAELAKHQKVLAQHWVDKEVVEHRIDDYIFVVLGSIKLKHVGCAARVSDHNHDD